MQVWNTAVFGKGASSGKPQMTFQYNGTSYHVTPEIVEEALHLPSLNGATPDDITDYVLFELVTRL